jgi:peptide chain release factor 2
LRRTRNGWTRCGGIFDEATLRAQLAAREAEAAAPGFWDDQQKARAAIARTNAVKALLDPLDQLIQLIEDAGTMLELMELEEDVHQQEAAAAEVRGQLAQMDATLRDLEFKTLLGEPFDANNAYVSLHAGAGGTESCDWSDMLLRMYRRYAEQHGFELSILDIQPGEEAGIKSVTFHVAGPYAYGYLKAERGVHRLVRISPFDANQRRHTSFAAVDVVAEIDDQIDVAIEEKDLRVDTYRSSGAGGQHVNTTDSAVRITHIPSGIIVACQAERSQHKNRDKAMKMLSAKLYEWEQDKQRKEMEKFYGDKGEIAWGSQIRSYVMQPYTLVQDHRTNFQVGNVDAVMDGALDDFIEAYLKKGRRHESAGHDSGE